MQSINNLPKELLVYIFEDLDCRDLRSTSPCCRNFHDLSEPYLYSSFVDSIPDQSVQKCDSRGRMPVLIWTLIAKPYLARHIKNYMGTPYPFSKGVDLSFLHKEERLWIKQHWLPAKSDQCWDALFGDNNWDAITVSLMFTDIFMVQGRGQMPLFTFAVYTSRTYSDCVASSSEPCSSNMPEPVN